MVENRRQFITRSGLLLGGAAALHSAGAVSAAPATRAARNAPGALTAFLTRCRIKSAYLTGGSVLGTGGVPACTRIAALVSDPVAVFARLPGDMPFTKAWVYDGGSLLLHDENACYRINFFDRVAWNSWRARIAAGEGIRFAHQALLRDLHNPAADPSDPFAVLTSGGRTVRLVGPQDNTLTGRVRSVLEGCIEGALYSLTPSAEFTALRHALLNSRPAGDAEARSVVDEFIASTALIAACCGSGEMSTFLTSPLISSSMERVFGRTGPQMVNAATSLPSGANTPPGAPWLAGILGAAHLSVAQGAVSIVHEDHYASLQARAALIKARAAYSSHS